MIAYTVSGKPYLQLSTWAKHQSIRNKKSKYPSADERDDEPLESHCIQLQATASKCPRNPIQSNPIVIQRDDNDFRGKLIQQWEAVVGMFPTASYPDAIVYMDKLQDRGALDWWGMAITETVDKAKRPSWQYMKAILEGWLAAGAPSTYTNGKTEKAPPKAKAGTQFIRNPSPDGTEWIYYDTATKGEVRREPRNTEDIY